MSVSSIGIDLLSFVVVNLQWLQQYNAVEIRFKDPTFEKYAEKLILKLNWGKGIYVVTLLGNVLVLQ